MEQCSICLLEIAEPIKIDCPHQFHLHCIKTWVKLNNVCPLCKTTVTKFIRNGVKLSTIEEPKRSFSMVVDNYIHGEPRRERVPWSQQPDLPGFVVEEDVPDVDRAFSESDESDVSEIVLKEEDKTPISTRTRSKKQ
jgi:hypothetical protein